MRATIELLFNLQQIDDQMDELRSQEDEIPERRAELDAEVTAIEDKIKAHKQQSLDLAKLRKLKEIELEAATQKKIKFQGQLFQVKSNREYEALQHEITALDEQVSKFEDEVLEIMEGSEKTAQAIVEEEKTLKATADKIKQEHAALDRRAEELRQVISEKSGAREKLIAGLNASLLSRYDRIRDVKDGLAVAVVKNGACSGCFRRIPPQEMQILRRNDKVITCEGCGRILIWRENGQ
jgi:predicted  nucleic acid-binding Zn-ribbon protein